LNKTNK